MSFTFCTRTAMCLALSGGPALGVGATIDLAGKGEAQRGGVVLVEQADEHVVFDVLVPAVQLEAVTIRQTQFGRVELPGAGVSGVIGEPQLPVYRPMILVPVGSTATVEVLEREVQTVGLGKHGLSVPVTPRQAPVEKVAGAQAAAELAFNRSAYTEDRLVGPPPATITDSGVIRGCCFVQVTVAPVQYNPARGELSVATRTRVKVLFSRAFSAAGAVKDTALRSKEFGSLLGDLFLNGGTSGGQVKAVEELPSVAAGSSFLIISAPAYVSDTLLQTYAAWKTQKGFRTVLVDTGVTGSTKESIRTYITNAYNTWPHPPAFVMLVGDTNTIPYWVSDQTNNPATDLYYAAVDGSDYFPDLYYSRLSVANDTDLENALGKILQYEQVGWGGDDTWIQTATFMAGNDNYTTTEGTHNYCIGTYLEPAGYLSHERYVHTYGATTTECVQDINAGLSLLIYSGHGSTTSWADGPPFYQSNVNGLTNTVYPFVGSHACLTGDFSSASGECFMETWLRAPHGAVTAWGSSVTSYWVEDDILERRYFDGYWQYGHTQIGPMTVYGMLRLYEYFAGGGATQRYFEMYNLMGDASIDIWSAPPQALSVTHTPHMTYGATVYQVNAGEAGVLCAVSKDGVLYGAAYSGTNGDAAIPFDQPISQGGEYTLACTAHNRLPFTDIVGVGLPGDFDYDQDVDQEDLGHMQVCLSGAGQQVKTDCTTADLDADHDADTDDMNLFRWCMSGPDVGGDPDCIEKYGGEPPPRRRERGP